MVSFAPVLIRKRGCWTGGFTLRHCISCMAVAVLLLAFPTTGPCQQSSSPLTPGPQNISFGGTGWAWFSQFANPAFWGALYMTPNWPKTGYYPLYPGSFSPLIAEDGIAAGPARLHPMLGIAELYTDNVFRTNANRQSDFATTLAPGIQAELPFGGSHSFVADYRTNIQTFHQNPSNNVQDQTASGRFNFNFPGGLGLDLQGEHKLGHDPRGSALDTQSVEVNKWTANSFTGQLLYDGANAGLRLNVNSTRWTYLNNDQGVFRNRLSNYAGLTLLGNVTSKTSIVMNIAANQELYDENISLNSTTYRASTGLRWNVTDLTFGELLAGYQHLKFNNAENGQSPSSLQFPRTADSFDNFFFMGNMSWRPTPFMTLTLQGYRSFQQSVVLNTLFFTSTGANLSAIHTLTDSTALTLNLGLEHDDFESSGATAATLNRVDTLKSVAFGIRYRALKWVGAGLQYIFEDRDSNVDQFKYFANSFMLSLQATF
jgi:hypothetical protein